MTLFGSIDEAAEHWAKTFNGRSILDCAEYGSTIYEVVNGGVVLYAYSYTVKQVIINIFTSHVLHNLTSSALVTKISIGLILAINII